MCLDDNQSRRSGLSGCPPSAGPSDQDLATLYGVETRPLLQAVKRNLERFPPDFMFVCFSAGKRDAFSA